MATTQIVQRQIADGAINDAKVQAGANIATSKLADGANFIKRDGSVAMTGALNLGSQLITNLQTPSAGTDAARNTTHGFDLVMFLAPGSDILNVRITNIHTDILVLDTNYTTDLPAINTGMCFKAEVRNGTTTSADNLEISKVYIETDY